MTKISLIVTIKVAHLQAAYQKILSHTNKEKPFRFFFLLDILSIVSPLEYLKKKNLNVVQNWIAMYEFFFNPIFVLLLSPKKKEDNINII